MSISHQSKQIADQQEQIDNLGSPEPPEFVDSVEEMTDTSESYVNTQTGTIWVYRTATYEKEVTVTVPESDITTEDNPYIDNARYSTDKNRYIDCVKIHI